MSTFLVFYNIQCACVSRVGVGVARKGESTMSCCKQMYYSSNTLYDVQVHAVEIIRITVLARCTNTCCELCNYV
jgi:hypothetical protein